MSRKITLDLLRIISILGVMTIHISSKMMGLGNESGWLYVINNAARFSVPAFLVISATLYFMKKNKGDYASYLKKRLGKLVPSYVFFTIVYFIFTLTPYTSRPLKLDGFFDGVFIFARDLVVGGAFSHLYFMSFIIIYTALYPLLEKLYRDKKMFFSIMMIFIFFAFNYYAQLYLGYDKIYRWTIFSWTIFVLFGFLLGEYYEKFIQLVKSKYIYFLMPIIVIFGYYYLYSFSYLGKNYFALGLINSSILNMMINLIYVALSVIIITKLFLPLEDSSEKTKSQIVRVSNSVFGVYLIHYLFVDTGYKFCLKNDIVFPVLAHPVLLFLTFVISYYSYNALNKYVLEPTFKRFKISS